MKSFKLRSSEVRISSVGNRGLERIPVREVKLNLISAGHYPPDDQVQNLPVFNRWGNLPQGVHDTCFEELIQRFATNPIRKALLTSA